MRLIYLGTPYHDPDPANRILRRTANSAVLAYYAATAKDICLHSSIVHWSATADLFDLPHSFDFWKDQDFFLIQKASAVWVLPLEGWTTSYGLGLELEYAKDIGREIFYVQLSDEGYKIVEDEENLQTYAPRDVIQASPQWRSIVPKAPPVG